LQELRHKSEKWPHSGIKRKKPS